MTYEVLARKWRPQQFADVVGQDHVTRTLGNAIRTQRVAHAYLLVGPRGVGKTSIARIFAKALNCAAGPTDQPCDRCPSCKDIMAGTHLDVLEIDGASNRGIDEIRALRDNVKYRSAGRYKVYIIDEVHMLTTEAFNALLKTLEEPPANTLFLFATTEPHKIPLTILSRCQRFDLRRITVNQLMERLAVIAKAEAVTIDNDALLAIARAAEGGLRDAESALDQLMAFQGKTISEENVLAVFGLVSRQALENLSEAVLQGDIPGVIRQVEELDRQGKDMQRLLVELLEYYRNLLIFLQVGEGIATLDLLGVRTEVLRRQAALTQPDRLLRITDILMETMDRLRYALSKKTLMETALIRCARAAVVVSLDEILRQIHDLRAEIGGGSSGTVYPSRSAETPASPDHRSHSAPASSHPALVKEQSATEPLDEVTRLQRDWHAIIEQVGKAAPLARAALLDSRPMAVTPERVTIGFDPEFADRIEQVGRGRNSQVLQRVLSDILKRTITVEVTVVKESAETGKTLDAGAGKTSPPANPRPPVGQVSPAARQKWLADETVRKTLDLFNGKIVDIRE